MRRRKSAGSSLCRPAAHRSNRRTGTPERRTSATGSFESVWRFIQAIARDHPPGLLLCLDDLHWADDSTLLLLEHLARKVVDAPLLIVATFRDSDPALGKAATRTLELLSRERLARRVELTRLTQEEVGDLLTTLGPSEPPDALLDVVDRETEGNPFFVVEVFEYLASDGRLLGPSGGWLPEIRVTAHDVPQSVRLVIDRRVERLSDSCASILALASVLGRTFDFALLRELAGLGEEALLTTVEEAEHARLLYSDAAGGVTFVHELIRQSLYSGLTALRRQQIHLRAAKAIERLYQADGEGHLAELANHYRLAGATADPARVIDSCVQAGEAAAKVFAWREAESHWQAALVLMERNGVDGIELAAHLRRLGGIYAHGRLQTPALFECLERAVSLYETREDFATAAGLHADMAEEYAFFDTLNIEKALLHVRAAEAIVGSTVPSADLVRVYTAVARAALQTLRQEDCVVASERAMELAGQLGDDNLWANAARMKAAALIHAGRFREADELHDATYAIFDRVDASEAARVLFARGERDRVIDNLVESAEKVRQELAKPRYAESKPLDLYQILYFAAISCGDVAEARHIWKVYLEGTLLGRRLSPYWLVYYGDGDWLGAQALVEDLWRTAVANGDVLNQANYGLRQGRAENLLANHASAERWLLLALDRCAGVHVPMEYDVRCELSLLYAETRRPELAAEHVRRCRELAAMGEDWHGLGGRHALAEAALAASERRWPEATEHFDRAVAIALDYDLPYQAARTLLFWGRALARSRHRKAAVAKLDEALELLRRCVAAQPWLDLVEADRRPLLSGVGASSHRGLTDRELEILRLIVKGRSSREIGLALALSIRTVDRHISNIYVKTDSHGRAQVTAYALNNGLT